MKTHIIPALTPDHIDDDILADAARFDAQRNLPKTELLHGEPGTLKPCEDCCCAQSWKALGVTEYDGRSIPEHISALRERNVGLLADAEALNDEIAQLRDGLVIALFC